MALPSIFTVVATVFFLIVERLFPGRTLPPVKGWYGRVLLINLVQLVISLSTMRLWIEIFGSTAIFKLWAWNFSIAEGFVAWFIGTFVFYWWHRLRHVGWFWLIFHQLHHSPSRIEAVTSFYKHPVEILLDAILSAAIIYPVLGCSLSAAYWYTFFAATGEYLYQTNMRTVPWMRYFIQTPELHSIHHQFDVHRYNFSDLPIWDGSSAHIEILQNLWTAVAFPRARRRS